MHNAPIVPSLALADAPVQNRPKKQSTGRASGEMMGTDALDPGPHHVM